MKAIGKRSISSFMKVLLDASWYVLTVSLGLMTILLVLCIFVDPGGRNLTLTVPVSLKLDADLGRVAAERAAEHAGFVLDLDEFRLDLTRNDARTSPSSLSIDGAEIKAVRAKLRFPVEKGPFLVVNIALVIVLLGLTLWLVTQLRLVFRTLRDGQPFVAANAARIRQVGFAVILGELARAATLYFDSYYTTTHFAATGVRLLATLDISGMAILDGLVILVVAEVFRHGTRLDEEQTLTI